MKKNRVVFIVILILIALVYMNLGGKSYADDIERLVIAGDINYPPYEFLDEQGNYSGFNVDIMRAISIELGIDIVLVPMEWNESILALKNGDVDAIQGMTQSSQREAIFDFSDALIENSQQIFVRVDNMSIRSLKDLDGKTVVFQEGDVNYEWIQKQIKINAVYKKDQGEAMKALIDGEVDAFVGNRHTGLFNIQKNNQTEKVKIVGEGVGNKSYASVVLEGNIEKLALINKGIRIIKSNGTYEKIYKKWFGEHFLDNTIYWRKLMIFVSVCLVLLLLVSIGIAYLNRKLKDEVEKRTEKIISQQNIIEASNRFRGQILDSIDNGIIAFDTEGKVTSINAAARLLLRNRKIKDLSYGQMLDELGVSDRSRAIKGSCVWEDEISGEIHLDYRALPIQDEKGTKGSILVLYDITLERHLQSIVNQRDKMVSIGRLSAGIAHELRNPLTAIKALVDMIPNKINDPVFITRMQSILPGEINRLNSLVDSLLDYAKPKPSKPEKFILKDMLKSVLSLHSVFLTEKRIMLNVDYADIEVLADRYQIKQVVINIVRNAVDAIDLNGLIKVSTFSDGEFGFIEISDDGNGIPNEHLKSIFEPFFTLKAQGYGIGLSICQQLVLENNGEILVESEEGKGTIVRIKLPMHGEV